MSTRAETASLAVSTEALSDVIKDCLAQGQEVILTITGNSMCPFLRHERDQVVLIKPSDPETLQVGDVPLYQRRGGQLVLHRIVERDDGAKRRRYGEKEPLPSMHSSTGLTYTMLGDAQTDPELNVHPDQIVAVATAFIRAGERVDCHSTAYRRRSLRWHKLLPLRAPLVRMYHLSVAARRKAANLFDRKNRE